MPNTADPAPGLPEGEAAATQAGLRYVDGTEPGITRRRTGKGFSYLEPDGARVRAEATLQRIRSLAIPSAWTGVWICRTRNGHLQATGRARLSYRGKGGARQEITLDDARLTRLVRHCQQLPGQLLFQYHDDEGELQPVGSDQVNDYLRDVMAGAFTAKDFRTWGGMLAAFRGFAAIPPPDDPDGPGVASTCNDVVKDVAWMLHNTPAVCRKSCIDPRVFDGWRDGSLMRAAAGARGERQWEQAMLRFLKARRRAERR